MNVCMLQCQDLHVFYNFPGFGLAFRHPLTPQTCTQSWHTVPICSLCPPLWFGKSGADRGSHFLLLCLAESVSWHWRHKAQGNERRGNMAHACFEIRAMGSVVGLVVLVIESHLGRTPVCFCGTSRTHGLPTSRQICSGVDQHHSHVNPPK